MAWSNSKIFSSFITDALNGTAAFDLNSDTLTASLYNDTITPSQTVASASAAYGAGVYASGEQSNGGWAAGGVTLTGVSSGFSSNVYTLDATDTANGTAATLSGVVGTLVYDNTLTTPVADQALSFNYLGGANSVTAGTFTVVWNASGIFALTL